MSVVERGTPRVAFQGERGAFSEEAGLRLLGAQAETVPRLTFESLFAAIREGAADAILAPVENTLAGSVHRCYDLLLESDLCIVAEVVHPIAHFLIGVPGARVEDVRSVESHPVALAQCENFFVRHPGIRRVPAEDTAGSVRVVVQAGDIARAAIASIRAAQVYGGTVLGEHLEDHRDNYTRFLLLRRAREASEPIPGANKLSLVLQLAHKPGSLCGALGVFAERNINLLRIESRPVTGKPWEYMFYLDLAASLTEESTQTALRELSQHTTQMRVLGCYTAAETPARK
ncbi:MAG TPA: prephenate dehydratase [Candidatus Acidoferrales bacterium]|nr:prephenate dehydratase [Candidatus Acidoferrales bacterium]